MTRENVIAAAKEAGFKAGYLGSHYSSTEALERFYTIVANQTKDQCAAICYEQNWMVHGSEIAELRQQLAESKEELSRTRLQNAIVYGTSHPEIYKTKEDELREQVKLLRDAVEAAWHDGYAFCGAEGLTDAQKQFKAAYAATEPKP